MTGSSSQHPGTDARPKGVTIYDVARTAGVAPSTVSRTFSRPGRVSLDTAALVRRVAEELGYEHVPMVASHATTRTKVVALAVPDVSNEFFGEIIHGAQAVARQSDYSIHLIDSGESARQERLHIERSLGAVDGVILASSRMNDPTIRMIAKQRPIVLLNRTTLGVPCIIADNIRGARRAVQHLSALGHDRITYLAGPRNSWVDAQRWQSARKASEDFGVSLRRMGPYPPTVAGGTEAALQVIERPTSGVMAYNDLVGIGLIRRLTILGVRVPREISVVGFDNLFVSQLVMPDLTTVAAPLRDLGRAAMRNLLACIHGKQVRGAEPVVLPTQLIVRGSTDRRDRRWSGLSLRSKTAAARLMS